MGRVPGTTGALVLCVTLLIGDCPSTLRAQQTLPGPHLRQVASLPVPNSPMPVGILWDSACSPFSSALGNLNQAEADLAAGRQLEEKGQEACVDLFYRAAMQAWNALDGEPCPSAANPDYPAAWQIYQESLARLIPAASRFGRLDPAPD